MCGSNDRNLLALCAHFSFIFCAHTDDAIPWISVHAQKIEKKSVTLTPSQRLRLLSPAAGHVVRRKHGMAVPFSFFPVQDHFIEVHYVWTTFSPGLGKEKGNSAAARIHESLLRSRYAASLEAQRLRLSHSLFLIYFLRNPE